MTNIKAEAVSRLEGYLTGLGVDRRAAETLRESRPGQYTVSAVVAAITDGGLTVAQARRVGRIIEAEAKTIRDAEAAITDALDRQTAAIKNIIDQVQG